MTRLLRRLRDERGIALVAALGIMVVLSMTTVTMVVYSSSNERHASLSEAQQLALALAEAGINNAQSVLAHGQTLALDANALTPPSGNTCPDVNPCFRQDYEGGYTLWRGEFNGTDPNIKFWTIWSWGVVRNPTVGGADVVRQLKATVNIVPAPDQELNATAWNYVIAWKTSNSTTCDMELTNTAHVDAPLYVAGNLCLRQSSKVYQPDDNNPVDLIVKGKLEVEQGTQATKSKVGESSAVADRIRSAEIVGGCTTSILNAAHVCNPNSPTSDRVWADTLSSTSTTSVTKPASDFPGWYQNANPGPMHACDPASATPLFDNDGVLDLVNAPNGSAGTIDLTPAASYSCIGRDAAGYKMGEISWDAPNRMLMISGAIYIDGSVLIDDNVLIKYSGQASLYLTGTFSMANGQTRLCAAWTGTDCDFATWDPNRNMLIIVAHGDNGTGSSIIFSQAVQFQGGLFAENAIDLGQSSRSEGPMIASTVKLANSVQIKPLPLIDTLPLGAPGNPNTHATPQKPNFTG